MKKVDAGIILLTAIALTLFFFYPITEFLPSNPKIIGSYVDEVSFIWILHRLSDNFIHFKSIFDGKILYPYTESLLTSECVILQSFIYRFFYFFVQNKISAFNFTVMSLFSFNLISTFWVFRKFFSRWVALIGSVLFAYHMVRFSRIGHIHVICTILYPLSFYFLYQWHKTSNVNNLYKVAVVIALQYYISLMSGLILMIGCFPFVFVDLFFAKKKLKLLVLYLKPLVLFVVFLSPLVFSYVKMALEIWPNISPRNANPYGNSFLSFFTAPNEGGEGWFVGWACLILAVPGFYYFYRYSNRREKWILYSSLVFIILFSMGTKVKLYNLFYLLVPGVQFLRVPERVAMIYLLGMVFIATLGLQFVSTKIKNQKLVWVFWVGVFTLILFENKLVYKRSNLPQYSRDYSEVLKSKKEVTPIVFIPYEDTVLDAFRMYHSLDHNQPIANGYTRFFPKSYFDIREIVEKKEYQKLKQYGIRYVIEDAVNSTQYNLIDLKSSQR